MSSPKYEITFKSAMMWANAELEHVGRIASLKDSDLQYAYAMSTLNGMAHLKDALYELVTDPAYETHHQDLQRTHDAVVRTMKHLKNTYNLDVDAIRAFNTRHTLSNLEYLEEFRDNVKNVEMPEMPEDYMMNATETEAPDVETESPEYQPKNTIERLQDGGRRRRSSKKRKSSRKMKKRLMQTRRK